MDIFKLKDLPASERLTIIEGENTGIEEGQYVKPLTDDETRIMQSEAVQIMIKKSLLENEFKEVKQSYKDQIDPLSDQIGEFVENMKTRSRLISGKLYKIPDYENKAMHFVDIDGNVINSRMMKPEERQFHIPMATPNREAI